MGKEDPAGESGTPIGEGIRGVMFAGKAKMDEVCRFSLYGKAIEE